MKKIMPVLFLGLVLFSCNNKKETTAIKNNDWTSQHLKGNVKSWEETTYTPDSTGKIGEMDSCCVVTQVFDEKGYNTGVQSKDSKGTLKYESTYTRYEDGQMKDIVNMADGKKTGTFSITIDKDGKYNGAKNYDSTGKLISFYTDLTEDEYGAVTSGMEHNADSTAKTSFTAVYDKGYQISSTGKDSSGKTTFVSKTELDDKGDMVKMTTNNTIKDSTTTTVTTYKYDSYDDAGNWTQRTSYNDKGKATKVTKRALTYYKKD